MAGAILLRSRVQETLARTVLLKWFKCPIFVAACAPLKYTVENDGRHGTFHHGDVGNTGRDGTLEMVDMSDFCRGFRAPPIDGGEGWQAWHS